MNISRNTAKRLFIRGGAWLVLQAGAFTFSIIVFFLVSAAAMFVGIPIVNDYFLFEGLNPEEFQGLVGLIVVAWTIFCVSACYKFWDQISRKSWMVFKRIDW